MHMLKKSAVNSLNYPSKISCFQNNWINHQKNIVKDKLFHMSKLLLTESRTVKDNKHSLIIQFITLFVNQNKNLKILSQNAALMIEPSKDN